MLKFSCKVLGESYEDVRKDTLQSRKKIIAMAPTLLITAGLWAVIGYLYSKNIFGLSGYVSLAVGSVMSLIIFFVDRGIILSKRNWWVGSLRIVLAVLLAGLGAFAIDDQLFSADIERELLHKQQEILGTELVSIDRRYQAELSNIEDSKRQNYQSLVMARQEAAREADGTGGSGIRGVNEIAKFKIGIADQWEKAFTEDQKRLQSIKRRIQNDKLEAEQRIMDKYNGRGILLRLQLLVDLIKRDPYARTLYFVLWVVWLIIEVLPVLIKCLYKTNYERKQEAAEIIGERRIKDLMEIDSTIYDPVREHPGGGKVVELLRGNSVSKFGS